MRTHQQPQIPTYICIPTDRQVPEVVYLEDEDELITTPSRSRSAKATPNNLMASPVRSTRRSSHTGVLQLPCDGFASVPPPPGPLRRWQSNETATTSNSIKSPSMPKRQDSFCKQQRRASAPTPYSHMRNSRWMTNLPSSLP